MAERQSAQMSEIENGTLGLYGTENSKCNHLMTLGFKGLTHRQYTSQYSGPNSGIAN